MVSPPVIADTGPLINLAGIGYLGLLPRLYGAVSIPRTVLDEFDAGKQPYELDLTTLLWLTVIDTVTLDLSLPGGLGPGEHAAISLAKTSGARLVLMDEDRARKVARQQDLQVAGTLAVLLRAKRSGLLNAIRPAIDAMIGQQRYFASSLLSKVLHDAGE